VPEELWLVIQKMMAKQPEQRFQDFSEVIDAFVLIKRKLDMEGFEDDTEALKKLSAMTRDLHVATPLTFMPEEQAKRTRNTILITLGAVLGVAVLVLGGLFLGGVFDKTPEPDPGDGTSTQPGPVGPVGPRDPDGSTDTEKPPELTPEEEAEKALEALLVEVESLKAREDYVEALRMLVGFPVKFRETPSWEKCEAEKPGVLQAAVPGIQRGLADIDDRLKAGEVQQGETRLNEVEREVEALSSAWPDAGTVEGWSDLVRETQEKKSRVRTLRAELTWISTVQRDPKVLGDEELDAALQRLEKDAGGRITGAEREASAALLVIKGEWNRRDTERYRRTFEQVSASAAKKAGEGLLDEAFKAIAPYLDSKIRDVRRTAQNLQRQFETLQNRIAGDMRKLEAVKPLIESPRWTDLDAAESKFEALLDAEIHKVAKARARSFLDKISEERQKRIASFAEQGLQFRGKGTYLLGSEDPHDQNEEHTGTLKAFLISKKEVTNAEYGRFVEETGHRAPRNWKGNSPPEEKADHPVTFVSASDARAYCRWLSETTGETYRLPTKEEWQLSAGWDKDSKTMRAYPWGDTFESGRANLGGEDSSPAGANPGDASPCGALDMAGNVCEWATGAEGKSTFSCGGCFDDENDPRAGRTAFCHALPPTTRGRSLGFRVVKVLE
jgi:hypothetical protein